MNLQKKQLIQKRQLIGSTLDGLESLKDEACTLISALQADDAYDPNMDIEGAFADILDALNTLDMIVKR